MAQIRNLSQRITRFWVKNQPKILFLAILAGVLIYLHSLPYFNFLLTPSPALVFYWLVVVVLFKLGSKASVIASITGLLLTGFATILLREDAAKEAADFAYYVIIIAFIQYLAEQRHAKR